MTAVEERVRRIVGETLGLPDESVLAESRFVDDLDADSLAVVELLLAAEEEFEMDIPDEDTDALTTVGKAVTYVTKRLEEKASR